MVIASSATSLHRKFCKPGVRMRGAVPVLSVSLSYQCYQLSVLSWYQYKLCCLEGKTSWAIFSPAGRTTNAIRYNLKHPHPLQQTSDCAKVPSWINTSSRCSKSWNTKHFQSPSVAQRYPKIKHDKTRYIIPDKNVVATDEKKTVPSCASQMGMGPSKQTTWCCRKRYAKAAQTAANDQHGPLDDLVTVSPSWRMHVHLVAKWQPAWNIMKEKSFLQFWMCWLYKAGHWILMILWPFWHDLTLPCYLNRNRYKKIWWMMWITDTLLNLQRNPSISELSNYPTTTRVRTQTMALKPSASTPCWSSHVWQKSLKIHVEFQVKTWLYTPYYTRKDEVDGLMAMCQ